MFAGYVKEPAVSTLYHQNGLSGASCHRERSMLVVASVMLALLPGR
jgi:hypothetical protein